jgi:hypothetical protein
MKTIINWNYPQPRAGFYGALDKFFGPGTTKAEVWIQAVFSLAAGIALPIYAARSNLGWSTIQTILATWMAFDLVGGIITNATSSAKRWYHRQGQGFRAHFGFIAFHVVYFFLVAWLYRDGDWQFAWVLSAMLLLAALIVLKTPLYLRRPLAFGMVSFAFVINAYVYPPAPGLEWFVPFLFFKLIVSHGLREEPYRPKWEKV